MRNSVLSPAPKRIFPGLGKRIAAWWPMGLGVCSFFLVCGAKNNPWMVEQFYSEGLYPILANLFGRLSGLVPFSVFECLILLTIGLSLLLLGMLCFPAGRKRFNRIAFFRVSWKIWVRRLCNLAGLLFFLFVFLCGLNYYRPQFQEFCGLQVRDSSIQELAALYSELLEEAEQLREQIKEDDWGVMELEGDFFQTAEECQQAFQQLAQSYAVLPALPVKAKPVWNSWLMSMAQITGQFTLTFEANINRLAPDYTIPATICHELAHTRGFMREDEANFIGYLACLESDSPQIRYSGVMLALVHVNNRLYEADQQLFLQLDQKMSEGIRRDFAYNNAYWAQFDDQVVAKVSEVVNDTYLKANNQTDGTRSYGRMVDLLLADYRARHGIS